MTIHFKQSWRLRAACLNVPVDTFFSSNKRNRGIIEKMCTDCPVKRECLELALIAEKKQSNRNSRFGIYGGMNPHQRALLNTCRYGECLISAPKGERFCSTKHKEQHEREINQRSVENLRPDHFNQEYYMQGTTKYA